MGAGGCRGEGQKCVRCRRGVSSRVVHDIMAPHTCSHRSYPHHRANDVTRGVMRDMVTLKYGTRAPLSVDVVAEVGGGGGRRGGRKGDVCRQAGLAGVGGWGRSVIRVCRGREEVEA